MNYDIAIDGPAGAGKSTIARALASKLGIIYVDTGAMYRAFGIYCLDNGISGDDAERITGELDNIKITVSFLNGEQRIILNGSDVTDRLRDEAVGNMASTVSVIPEVREKLVELQKELAVTNDVVMDGRDIGTVVLPKAALKIYLTASVEERARRRYKQLLEKGETPDIEAIKKDIEERDFRDMNRKASPLKKADDAVEVDSSDMNAEEVENAILREYLRLFNIHVAENAGFCFGVTRAMNILEDCISKNSGNIYTLGPIIHNEHVVRSMEEKGVRVLGNPSELDRSEQNTVVIRSHGVSKEVFDSIGAAGAEAVDATCPFVTRIHEAVRNESRNGRKIIIIGDEKHPEVTGTMGWSESECIVISDISQITDKRINPDDHYLLVAQTTFNIEKFNELVENIQELGYDIIVLNTICNSTEKRQKEACELASVSDIMLVIGSRSSSNTGKLYDVCKERCGNTYLIQELDDLVSIDIRSDSRVGITAGASTPNYIIQEVSLKCQKNKVLKSCSNQH